LKNKFTTYTDANGITIQVYKPRKIGKNQKTFKPSKGSSTSVFNRIASLPVLNIIKGIK